MTERRRTGGEFRIEHFNDTLENRNVVLAGLPFFWRAVRNLGATPPSYRNCLSDPDIARRQYNAITR